MVIPYSVNDMLISSFREGFISAKQHGCFFTAALAAVLISFFI